MSGGILGGLRIVEGSAFVAAPLGGMTLAQLGADVIRYDQLGGGLDYGRWPLAPDGQSLFWAGLNKGKRSLRVDLRSPEGMEIVAKLITAPGPDAGIFLTNLPVRGPLAYDALAARRPDVIVVLLTGNADGSSEVDYTVNAAMGFPSITGPAGGDGPINSVLPAWDIALGEMAAVGILAAERHRRLTGKGSLVRLALSDVALAATAALGRLAQAQLSGNPEADGTYLYGAFGGDFATGDGRRVMVVGLTDRQWAALKQATTLDVAAIAEATGALLDDPGGRYAARHAITAALAPWFAARSLKQVQTELEAAGASWGPYQTFRELLGEDPRASLANPMFAEVDHPGIGSLLTPGSPLRFSSVGAVPPLRAPRLGEHTDAILAELGFSPAEVRRLHDSGVVAGLDV